MGTNGGDRSVGLAMKIVIALVSIMMAAFLSLVIYSAGQASAANFTSNAAATSANEASDQAAAVAADLSIHSARQNGEYGSINSQLSTLRTYHSTLRGEMKDQRDERGEEIKELREMVNELLRQSYSENTSPP